MRFLKFLKNLFSTKELTEYELAKRTIKKMGYKSDGSGAFVKDSREGRTMIWITNNGVKIKAYFGGYAESEFLPRPIDKEKLKYFIKINQV